ncbi:HAD-IIA family hydrolase [Ilumatobacter sp.]|uniref:HAD-IIA family hydrolase n=1 Tax=Ilumatobacter sp. TaxID=1967498 RepID=UPI003B52B602
MIDDVSTVLCDLDGVVWLSHEPIDGSVAAIERIRASGRRVLFVTNNSAALVAEHEGSLREIGIEAAGDVVSSSMAAATLVVEGERVLVAGGPGVGEAVESAGAVAVASDGREPPEAVDAVVVGLHRDFDYARLRVAGRAVLGGARLIGTNGDTTYPTPDGLEPGGGSLVAAVAAVGGVEAVIAGKPHQPMADLIRDLVADPSEVLMVGDRPSTDGLFARRIGCRFALVETGVTGPGDEVDVDVPVELRADDLAAVADALGGGHPSGGASAPSSSTGSPRA